MGRAIIEPRVLKGFQDTLPNVAIQRQRMMRQIEDVFASFGFAPIDTPALEYAEILLGKGSAETDRQLYRFQDNGGRDVALRFDLTVPLARFIAQHVNKLGIPFKRYHLAPVWRAEKPQRGRFREFVQCDFDIIGSESVFADVEILAVISACLRTLGVEHLIRINNRRLLGGLLEKAGAQGAAGAVLRAIDKLEKLGRETVVKELSDEAKLSASAIDDVLRYLELRAPSNEGLVVRLKELLGSSTAGAAGIRELSSILAAARSYGITDRELTIDLSIARGLDYYTGTVFETKLAACPEIGSICSGGRYDDLASLYSARRLPGVGASIGLDRLLAGLEAAGKIETTSTPAKALVTLLDDSASDSSIQIVTALRQAGIAAELFPQVDQLGLQLKYADHRGIPFVVIIGAAEKQKGVCAIKNLRTKEQLNDVPFEGAAARLRELLSLEQRL